MGRHFSRIVFCHDSAYGLQHSHVQYTCIMQHRFLCDSHIFGTIVHKTRGQGKEPHYFCYCPLLAFTTRLCTVLSKDYTHQTLTMKHPTRRVFRPRVPPPPPHHHHQAVEEDPHVFVLDNTHRYHGHSRDDNVTMTVNNPQKNPQTSTTPNNYPLSTPTLYFCGSFPSPIPLRTDEDEDDDDLSSLMHEALSMIPSWNNSHDNDDDILLEPRRRSTLKSTNASTLDSTKAWTFLASWFASKTEFDDNY